MAFKFQNHDWSFSTEMIIGLSYIFRDYLRHRKDEKERLKRKRFTLLKDMETLELKSK